jgi:hypothetical protein
VYWVDVVLPPNVTIDQEKYQVRTGRAVRVEHECPDGTAMPGVVADADADDRWRAGEASRCVLLLISLSIDRARA